MLISQGSITVHAPVERVFGYIVDITRHSEWTSNLRQCTQTSPGTVCVGSTFKAITFESRTHGQPLHPHSDLGGILDNCGS